MIQMGFGEKWRRWINGCLSSSRYSVLINGSATKEFRSPKVSDKVIFCHLFLFIIAMEGLNVAMKSVCQKLLFQGIKIPNDGPSISHLFYVDDAIFLEHGRALTSQTWCILSGVFTRRRV